MPETDQLPLFEEMGEHDDTAHEPDKLLALSFLYQTSEAYAGLLRFVARFRACSPYNALLVHAQMPGAKLVAPPDRWLRDYGRRIRPGARPIVVLQPKGPVIFVFDVSDTEPTDDARSLPLEEPIATTDFAVGHGLEPLVESAKRDGVRIVRSDEGSQAAGSICRVDGATTTLELRTAVDRHRNSVIAHVPLRYDLLVNGRLSPEAQFAAIARELARLYCGHLGTADGGWWPTRPPPHREVADLEAESVAYLVCGRAGIDSASERHLADYLGGRERIPPIHLGCVVKATGVIEAMSRVKTKSRKST